MHRRQSLIGTPKDPYHIGASKYTCELCGHKMMGGRYAIRDSDGLHLVCPSCWNYIHQDSKEKALQ